MMLKFLLSALFLVLPAVAQAAPCPMASMPCPQHVSAGQNSQAHTMAQEKTACQHMSVAECAEKKSVLSEIFSGAKLAVKQTDFTPAPWAPEATPALLAIAFLATLLLLPPGLVGSGRQASAVQPSFILLSTRRFRL